MVGLPYLGACRSWLSDATSRLPETCAGPMGVTGFLPLLEKVTNTVSVCATCKGSKIAVDGHGWLHLLAVRHSVQYASTSDPSAIIADFLERANLLSQWGIMLLFVFDGPAPPAKGTTSRGRAAKRQAARELLDGGMTEADDGFARACAEAVHVSQMLVLAVIKAMRAAGFRCIKAAHEADAQLAHMARCGDADFIMTEDGDLLVHGAPKILTKMR